MVCGACLCRCAATSTSRMASSPCPPAGRRSWPSSRPSPCAKSQARPAAAAAAAAAADLPRQPACRSVVRWQARWRGSRRKLTQPVAACRPRCHRPLLPPTPAATDPCRPAGIGKVTEQTLAALGTTTCGQLLEQRGLLGALFKPASIEHFQVMPRLRLGRSPCRREERGGRMTCCQYYVPCTGLGHAAAHSTPRSLPACPP
jgi:hypothetical protein